MSGGRSNRSRGHGAGTRGEDHPRPLLTPLHHPHGRSEDGGVVGCWSIWRGEHLVGLQLKPQCQCGRHAPQRVVASSGRRQRRSVLHEGVGWRYSEFLYERRRLVYHDVGNFA